MSKVERRESRTNHGRGELQNKSWFQRPVKGVDWEQVRRLNVDAILNKANPIDVDAAVECVAYRSFEDAFQDGRASSDTRKLLEIAQVLVQHLLKAHEKTALENKLLKKERKLFHRRISYLQKSNPDMESTPTASSDDTHTENPCMRDYTCFHCKKDFISKSFLRMHCRRRHNGQGIKGSNAYGTSGAVAQADPSRRQAMNISEEVPMYSRGTSMEMGKGSMDLLTKKKLSVMKSAWKWAEVSIRESHAFIKQIIAEREANTSLLAQAPAEVGHGESLQPCKQQNCVERKVELSIIGSSHEGDCGCSDFPNVTAEASTSHREPARVHRSTETLPPLPHKGCSSIQRQDCAKSCFSTNHAVRYRSHPGVYSRHNHSESSVVAAQEQMRDQLHGKNFLLFVQQFDVSLAVKLQRLGVNFAADYMEMETCNNALQEVRSRINSLVNCKSAPQRAIYREETETMWRHLDSMAYLQRTEESHAKLVSTG